MIKYQVRSKELIDLVNDIKNKRLILSPYFQRNVVWRDLHKIEFIKTILMGLPFPQIFIARGTIDVDTMTSNSCIVDGQQRTTAIMQFIKNELQVDDKRFSDLNSDEKEEFLKFQVPIIDLDIKEDDPLIIEIFKRLNRTYYSLSIIEKQATEYASSEFMITAKILTDELFGNISLDDQEEEIRGVDPNIPPETVEWAKTISPKNYFKFIQDHGIFTTHEISRKVPLSFTLTIMATCLSGFFNRSRLVNDYLETYAAEFEHKNTLIESIDKVAKKFNSFKFRKGSYWQNKANAFSLFMAIYNNFDLVSNESIPELKNRLESFAAQLPADYSLAAKEAVNNKRERILRDDYICRMIAGESCIE